ncbi:hypothetical protein [Romboutsia hominis]|uniref:hypothetical protein n=1 Tax=Romboutsia hominis TaxID=1507512 RepID=UPI000B2D7923|nr:hypothetical protein [Romboutsia hominis]
MRKNKKRKLSYTKAVVIVHGKSELQIVDYIKSNLRISIESFSEKKGYNSIQINGLKNVLGNTIFKDIDSFLAKYQVEVTGKGKRRRLENFRIFIIMDTDDCTSLESDNFINKAMFKNHWAKDYIHPIYNKNNLEDVLKKCDIEYKSENINKIKDKDLKKYYVKIFPTDKSYNGKDDIQQLLDFEQKLRDCKITNMNEFVEYCINISKERK